MKKLSIFLIVNLMLAWSLYADSNSVASANVLGYTKITIPSNQYVLVARNFEVTNNTIAGLFSDLPSGSLVYIWNTASQSYNSFSKSRAGWGIAGTNVIEKGRGVFISLPANVQTNLLLSGSVPVTATTAVFTVNGYAAVSFPYPATVPFTNTAIAKGAASGDIVSFWTNGWVTYSRSRAGWDTNARNAQVEIGKAFFYKASTNGQKDEICPYTIN